MKFKLLFCSFCACLASSCSFSQESCDDIAVLSDDASYIILDSETLELQDVGNLWWLGIKSIDGVVKGSSLTSSALISKSFVKADTGELIPKPEKSIEEFYGVYMLKDLGRGYSSQMEISYFQLLDNEQNAFIEKGAEKNIVRFLKNNSSTTIEAYDQSLNKVNEWGVDKQGVGVFNCMSSESIYTAGIDTVFKLKSGNSVELIEINGLDRSNGFRITNIADQCYVLLTMLPNEGENEINTKIINLEMGAESPVFKRSRFSNIELFSEEGVLVQQNIEATQVDAVSIKVEPGNKLSILNINSGEIERSESFELNGAELVGKRYCGESRELLFMSDKELILFDVDQFKIRARIVKPLPSRYLLY